MRTRAALLFCLLPSLAVSQTSGQILASENSTTGSGGRNDGNINIAECAGTGAGGIADAMTFNWVLNTTTPTTGSTLTLYLAKADIGCPPTATAKTPLESPLPNTVTTSGPYQVASQLIGPLGITNCASGALTTLNLCVTELTGTTETARAVGTMVLDGTTPSIPVVTGATPGDGALNVAWDAGTGGSGVSASYKVLATAPAGCVAPACAESHLSGEVTGSTSYRMTGLTNKVTYDVRVIAFTEAGNPSADYSAPFPGTPQPVDDFWTHYQAAGGREQGGCGLGGDGPLALLALLPLVARLRRRNP